MVLLQESDDEEDRRIEMQRRKEKEKRREEQEKYRSGSRTKFKQKNNDDHLDPMDPSAYSDVPRYERVVSAEAILNIRIKVHRWFITDQYRLN